MCAVYGDDYVASLKGRTYHRCYKGKENSSRTEAARSFLVDNGAVSPTAVEDLDMFGGIFA